MGKFRKMLRPLKKAYVTKVINRERKYEESLIINNYPKNVFTPLTNEEKKKVCDLWGVFSSHISFKEYEVYKTVRGFDERFLSHNLYLPIIAHLLNDYHYTKFFEDKGLLGYAAKCNYLKFPYCYTRCINGEFYDNEMRQVSEKDALVYCASQEEFIIKISRESSGGHGVSKVVLSDKTETERLNECRKQFGMYGNNFVVQKCLRQHQTMSRFNSSSINTLRVTSLYLNGTVSVQSIILRIGKQGAFVDNLGSGGIGVGVNTKGELNNIGYTYSLQGEETYNNVVFANAKIEQMESILSKIKEAHIEMFPLCKLIGWDVCIDENNEPVIIEINSSQPGISGEQLNCGPVFGNRTQEVIDYCKHKKFVYNKFLFNY